MALVRYGIQLLTKKGSQLTQLSKNFHVASVSCQTERKYEEIDHASTRFFVYS